MDVEKLVEEEADRIVQEADHGMAWCKASVTVGDLRRARTALESTDA